VLADESLLIPMLHSLPKNVEKINVTMDVPLASFPAAQFFKKLIALHLRPTASYYYKDVLAILQNPLVQLLGPGAKKIFHKITSQNLSWVSWEKLQSFAKNGEHELIAQLFGNWKDESTTVLNVCSSLVETMQQNCTTELDTIVLKSLRSVFTETLALCRAYGHPMNIAAVQSLLNEILQSKASGFNGDAYNGLQLMGLLETRCLDFENIIVLSVNEGALPAARATRSYIAHDMKIAFNLPFYKEKDAVYAYHFYRLLYRAKNIWLLYSNYSEGLQASEKSRFILQLEMEKHPNHKITTALLSQIPVAKKKEVYTLQKTASVINTLKKQVAKGFSPSALTTYIRNPIDFYHRHVLCINETEEVEETIAHTTLGTVVHDTLQTFYQPLVGSSLSIKKLEAIKKNIPVEVTKQFSNNFKLGDISTGKNLIVFEVAKRYVTNLIQLDIAEIEAGNTIKILQIETDLTYTTAPLPQGFPIKIRGKVDRVDLYNGQTRIIDYKTGNVQNSHLEIVDWGHITTDYKYSKAFQLLAYALMLTKGKIEGEITAGIISFKNMARGFLPFATKPKANSRAKNYGITPRTLSYFEAELKKLITEICDKNIPFTEKEIE
ncbi:MAG: PD-(D/E)XK nuclease family protein, partial [Marinirhabdus sp.]